MVRITENIIPVLLLFILMLGIMGCVREDDSGCIRGVYIYFNPENHKHNYPDLVRTVNLYFYDEAGELATGFMYDEEGLNSDSKAVLVENLPVGKYTLVSIINDDETYRTINEQKLESVQSNLKDKVIDYPLADFFSGILELTVEGQPRLQKATVDIFKHNNDIRLEIITDKYDPPYGVIFNAYIEGNNGAYNYYSASCPEGHSVKYLPHHPKTDNNGIPITYDFTIMRLWRNADITLCLQEEVPFEGIIRNIRLNIADELAKVVNDRNEFLYDTDEKLSFNDEYKIVVTLGPGFIVMELAINDWTVIRGGIDI